MRLRPGRIVEIHDAVVGNPGGTFACHKTTGAAGRAPRTGQSFCAGALAFATKAESYSQFLRIAGRLGSFDPEKVEGIAEVWDDLDEWLEGGAL